MMGKPGVMLGLPERHEAATSTPVLDLCGKVLAAISVPGVTLGLILAAGYAADGRPWVPVATIVAVVLALNLAVLGARLWARHHL